MTINELNELFDDLMQGIPIDNFRLLKLQAFCFDEKVEVSLPDSFWKRIKDEQKEVSVVLRKPISILLQNVDNRDFTALEIEKIIEYLIGRK